MTVYLVLLRLNSASSEALIKRVETVKLEATVGEGIITVNAEPEEVTIPTAIQAELPKPKPAKP